MHSPSQAIPAQFSAPRSKVSPAKTILLAGLVAGLLDGADALLFNSWFHATPPRRVLQFIASGVLGLKSFQGGWSSATLGALVHLGIAVTAAAVFYALSRRLPALLRQPALWGTLYGLAIFAIMHFLVVPLSAAPRQRPLAMPDLINLLLAHILCVGLPIAYLTARDSPSRP